MKFRIEDCVQRAHHFAIVDEVDSILIDEARTPLIISGPSEESTDKYYKINHIIPKLIRGEVIEGKEPGEKYTTGDYTVDEKHRPSRSPKRACSRLEKLLNIGNLYDPPEHRDGTTTSSRRCAPTCSTSAIGNTSSRTATKVPRWSSSTSSPAA